MSKEHITSVEEQDNDTYDVECSCGWSDSEFEEREDAECAAEDHERTGN